MSLSFVSKTVQTATNDGKFEETEIEGSSNNHSGGHQPLFEQLRANQEQAQAAQDEADRQKMRQTLALDEEDAAHLSSLQRHEQERREEEERRTREELAAFRAAQVDRGEENQSEVMKKEAPAVAKKARKQQQPATLVPKIVVKKKRKIEAPVEKEASKKEKSEEEGLGGLLAGYDSSSSEGE